MKDKRLAKQQGYLVIVAILIIIVVGFLGAALTSMLTGSAIATNNYVSSENTLYLAEAGFEQAARLLLTSNLTGTNPRIACASLDANSNLTNKSFGAGTFTAIHVAASSTHVNTTLTSAINSTATSIPVTSTSGFAPAGNIRIDNEVINYGSISGNSFIGIQRGANYNYNTAHANGAPVSQFQCMIDVNGGIPNLSSPLYQREIQQAVPLQEGWAVGSNSGTSFVTTHWNQPSEIQWNDASFADSTNNAILNSVSFLSNAQGWAVGNVKGTNLTIIRWNASNWTATPVSGACSTQNLLGVSTVSSQEAWAAGGGYRPACASSGNFRYNIVKWNGSSWTILTPTTTPPVPADSATLQNLNAIHVIGTAGNSTGNLGFAVGAAGIILKFNGTTWTVATSPTTHNLTGVFVVSASEAWAVGAAGTIIKWNGSTWSTVTSPTTTDLSSITMLDATLKGTASAGWAVGSNGVALTYNGSSWTSQNTSISQNLLSVAMFNNPNDVWAVGAAGHAVHWNGTIWTDTASGESVALNGIALIAPQQYPFAWQEIYS